MISQHQNFTPDLAALVARQPSPLSAVDELTSIRSERQLRASFKLTFTSGLILKGRSFRTAERCRMATLLLPYLEGLPVNAVIDSLGGSWLETWIAGLGLTPADTTVELCRWAGDLLGRIHTLPVFEHKSGLPPTSVDDMLNKLNSNLALLGSCAALSQTVVDRLRALAVSERPLQASLGLTHTDFTVENFVKDEGGNLHVIDNEHLSLGPLDYDVVRTLSRWPMTSTQRLAFLEGYDCHRDAGESQRNAVFWAVIGLAQSARVRRLHNTPCDGALQALERLAAGQRHDLWPTLV
ncbi:MAG: aminoglycoside phosphotransferase family protein [Pseudomonadota bacterium]